MGKKWSTVFMACTHLLEGTLKVGSHHFAGQFLKSGWSVTYLSAPITPFHLALIGNKDVRRRIRAVFRGRRGLHNNLVSYVPFSFIAPDGRPLLNSRLVTSHWHRTLFPKPRGIVERLGLAAVDVLYIDNIFQGWWLDTLSHEKSVFRVMDNHGSFPGWKGRAEGIAASLAARADLTIYSARSLEPYVRSLSPKKSRFIPNGVDSELFQNEVVPLNEKAHNSISKTRPPRALYVGAIDHRLDMDLVKSASKKLPHVTFVLAGPIHRPVDISHLPSNVLIVGPVPHLELPALMKEASLGIIPFNTRNKFERIEGIRPLKLLEYLAAGLPVVCARWPEVESMNSPAFLYETEEEFIKAINTALEIPYSTETAQAFAKDHDWSKSFAALIDSLDNTANPW